MKSYLKTNYELNDDAIVSVIDELPLWSAPFGIKLLEKINYKKEITAVDIGSGTGFPMLEIAMRLGNSCKVFGIDPWSAATNRIKTKIKIYGIDNAEIITGAAEKIPLSDNSVDLIYSNNGFNNVNELSITLKECARISKAGAQLIFTFNTEKTMIEFYSVLEQILEEMNLYTEINLMKEHIYKKRRPVEEYHALLTENRFKLKEIIRDEFAYHFVDAHSMFNHFLIKLAFLGSWMELIPKEKQNEVFIEAESRLNIKAQSNGELKLTVPFILMDCVKT